MSGGSYMDSVPVKIAEAYKPPPRLYQLPQAVANKLALPPAHFDEAPQYFYSFQLERKVLAKIPEWRRMRQQERDARSERKERRERERLQEIEAQHKLLGAVRYPSTDDLSSTSSEVEEEAASPAEMEAPVVSTQTCNFHDILQPTIAANTTRNGPNFEATKLANSFNYKDFEDDTSSPFDTVELKTINDLDILAQVLYETRVRGEDLETDVRAEESVSDEAALNVANHAAPSSLPQEDNKPTDHPSEVSPTNIPNEALVPQTVVAKVEEATHTNTSFPRFEGYREEPLQPFYPQPHAYAAPQHGGHVFLTSVPFLASNAAFANTCAPPRHTQLTSLADAEVAAKSKSVPDILKELRDEVRNSQLRRTRNYSNNADRDEAPTEGDPHGKPSEASHFSQLEGAAQQLAKNISSMGFPLERVAKLTKFFEGDDKKIIEHLIPLGELMDLGFDETRISEALLQCGNNKEKALEALIS